MNKKEYFFFHCFFYVDDVYPLRQFTMLRGKVGQLHLYKERGKTDSRSIKKTCGKRLTKPTKKNSSIYLNVCVYVII